MGATELSEQWRDALDGVKELALDRANVSRFTGLVDGMSPPDLRAVPDLGSKIVDLGEGVALEFDARLVPTSASDNARAEGGVHRRLNTAEHTAEHVNLELLPAWRGQRRGARAVCRHVLLYRRLGITDAYLDAAEVGSYYWAACGFDFDTAEDRDRVVDAAADLLERLGLRADLGGVAHSWDLIRVRGQTTPRELADAFGEEFDYWLETTGFENLDEPIPLGRALLRVGDHGGWRGHLDLRAQSPGLVQLARYGQCDGLLDR